MISMKNSSNSATSLDKFATNDAAAGCLAGVLRRLLCNSLNSHRATQEDEEKLHSSINGAGEVYKAKVLEQKKPAAAPCIVARLMGLDSMPVHPYPPPDSIRRSRSTSSIESWPVFITGQRSNRTSSPLIPHCSSFREVPTYLRKENDDFLLLSFTNEDEAQITRSVVPHADLEEKIGKCDAEAKTRKKNSNGVVKQRRNFEKKCGAGVEVERNSKPVKQRMRHERSSCDFEKSKNLVENRKKLDFDCNSENASPDSVLDSSFELDAKYFIESNSLPSSEAKKEKGNINSRRKLSAELEILISSSNGSPSSRLTKDGVMRTHRTDESELKEITNQNQNHNFDVSRNVYDSAEQEVMKTSWIGVANLSAEAAEIAREVGLEILDLLLLEEVAECSKFFPKFSNCILEKSIINW